MKNEWSKTMQDVRVLVDVADRSTITAPLRNDLRCLPSSTGSITMNAAVGQRSGEIVEELA
jgi:hypothetical protein